MRRSVAFTALLFMAPLAACQAPAPEVGPPVRGGRGGDHGEHRGLRRNHSGR